MSADARIVVVDVGSSSARVHVYNSEAQIVLSRSAELEVQHPQPLHCEYDPEQLWRTVQRLLLEIFRELPPNAALGLGLTTQRNSLLVWDRSSGLALTPVISWQDRRTVSQAAQLNSCLRMRALRCACRLLHAVTGGRRFLAGAALRFKVGMCALQAVKFFSDWPSQLRRARGGQLCVACLDSWLLWKLTGGAVFATDVSSAASTGMYDPFCNKWSRFVTCWLLRLPLQMLPAALPTCSIFGTTDVAAIGAEVAVTSISGDQSAATFGELCHSVGQVKVTLGTGSFLNWNTGSEAFASVGCLYPVIGWQLPAAPPTFLVEGSHCDTGNTLRWGRDVGFYNCVEEAEAEALAVTDCGGVYFVPCFSGSSVPHEDPAACGGFVGVSAATTRRHMARALMEAVAFQTKALVDAFQMSNGCRPLLLRANGGVSSSGLILQLVADLVGCEVTRARNREATSLGCAFLAGIGAGVWTQAELARFDDVEARFLPSESASASASLQRRYSRWLSAVRRCGSWW